MKKAFIILMSYLMGFLSCVFLIFLAAYFFSAAEFDEAWLRNPDNKTKSLYFPPITPPELKVNRDPFSCYNSVLLSMKEPILWPSQPASESYRFLWDGLGGRPFCIRIEILPNSTAELTYKVIGWNSETKSEFLMADGTKKLSQEEVATFRREIDRSRFWKKHSHKRPIDVLLDAFIFLDGSAWIVEGSHQGQYYVVKRRAGGERSFKNLCLYFLELSDLDEETVIIK